MCGALGREHRSSQQGRQGLDRAQGVDRLGFGKVQNRIDGQNHHYDQEGPRGLPR